VIFVDMPVFNKDYVDKANQNTNVDSLSLCRFTNVKSIRYGTMEVRLSSWQIRRLTKKDSVFSTDRYVPWRLHPDNTIRVFNLTLDNEVLYKQVALKRMYNTPPGHFCRIPGPFILKRRRPSKKAATRKTVLLPSEHFEWDAEQNKYKRRKGLDPDEYKSSFNHIKCTTWRVPSVKKNVWAMCRFRLFAYDFETRPSDAIPVMVCCTEQDLTNDAAIEVFYEAVGPECHHDLLHRLIRELKNAPGGTYMLILGFNSSRFDNIIIADAIGAYTEDPWVKMDYLESNGRIIDITFTAKHSRSKLIFRDILLYYPVGLRGRLGVMADNLKLDHQKGECSLEVMEQVANLIMAHIDDEDPEEQIEACDDFWKELEYCRQDTRVLFGLARYIGNVFISLEGPAKALLHYKPRIIPPVYAYLVPFITLPQVAINYLPFLFPELQPSLAKMCAITDPKIARLVKCTIYGGRTICSSIGQIVRGVTSTDIVSEYPEAMCGPMPTGRPFEAGIRWINKMNAWLADDELFSNNFNFALKTRPFVAYVELYKPREEWIIHDDETGIHRSDQTLPFIPYRPTNQAYLEDPFKRSAFGQLEWLADTNGELLYGMYNCVDIYHMRRLGFRVRITTYKMPIVWPGWSFALGTIFENLYISKADAAAAGNAALTLIVKILLNSSIGKWAQMMVLPMRFDGRRVVRESKTGYRNKSRFQTNSFCMSWSRIINQGHQSLISKGEWIPDYDWTPSPLQTRIDYGDTDNLIFNASVWRDRLTVMQHNHLLPSRKLCSFNMDGTYFQFSLEFEDPCGKECRPLRPSPDAPYIANVIFLGRKSYVMQCQYCSKIRLKAKGHNKSGLQPEDICKLFDEPLEENAIILSRGLGQSCSNSKQLTVELFRKVYPTIDEDALGSITSGPRFTFKVSLPSSGKLGLEPRNVERSYTACIPPFQQRCTICFAIKHK